MLQVFGFKKVGVAVSDLYFVDPQPGPGQEGAERGVRLEVRFLESPAEWGTIYASRPIVVDRPIWRADLLERVDGPAGSFDRTHHHPHMEGWEPGSRQYEPEMSAQPLGWVASRLGDLHELMKEAGIDPGEADPADAEEMRQALPDILAAVQRLLDGVHAGELARAPVGTVESARISWL